MLSWCCAARIWNMEPLRSHSLFIGYSCFWLLHKSFTNYSQKYLEKDLLFYRSVVPFVMRNKLWRGNIKWSVITSVLKVAVLQRWKKCFLLSAVCEGFTHDVRAFPHWLRFCNHWLRSSWVEFFADLLSGSCISVYSRHHDSFQFQSELDLNTRAPGAMLIAWLPRTTLFSLRILFIRQNNKIKLTDSRNNASSFN